MSEKDVLRDALFNKIDQRTFHVRLNDGFEDQPLSPSGGESDGEDLGRVFGENDESSAACLSAGIKAPKYPSKEFVDHLHDKIVVIGIKAYHLATDRDLQRLLLDQTTRLVLSPSEVTHLVAQRWMLKKLLDARRKTVSETSSHARWTQRRFQSSLQIRDMLEKQHDQQAVSLRQNGARGTNGSSQHRRRRSKGSASAGRVALEEHAFKVYSDALMSIAEQIVELRECKELAKQRELLKQISQHKLIPKHSSMFDGSTVGNHDTHDGDDSDDDDAPSIHRCGRTSRFRLPKGLTQEAKGQPVASPRKTQANQRSWYGRAYLLPMCLSLRNRWLSALLLLL